LPPQERRIAGQTSHILQGPAARHDRRTGTISTLIEAHRSSAEWAEDIKAATRKAYTARGNVLNLWLGDVETRQIRPSEAARTFRTLLDVGFYRHDRMRGARGLEAHQAVFNMSRGQREILRANRIEAMDVDPELAARPPGYSTAFYVMLYAGTLITWANRAIDAGLINPFSKMGLASPAGRVRYIEPHELNHLVETADRLGRQHLGDAAGLAVNTVQRKGDLLTLGWHVHQDGRFRVAQEKTGEVVDCKFTKALMRRLDAAWERARERGIHPTPDAPILDYPSRDHITREWDLVRRHAAETMPSVADITFHDLRDTGFTRLIEAVNSLVQACQVSGHSIRRAATIEKAYLAKRTGIADAAIDRTDRWMTERGVSL
ncbi:MAG: tyrosine-type recombinase/integrase, partial [Pseudomonadota bacterium]